MEKATNLAQYVAGSLLTEAKNCPKLNEHLFTVQLFIAENKIQHVKRVKMYFPPKNIGVGK